jgi:hypothetical protein
VSNPDWSGELAVVLHTLGRGAELIELVGRLTTPTPWLQAALAIACSRFDRAADLYAQIGSLPDEAFARLQAAKQLLATGRRAEGNIPCNAWSPFTARLEPAPTSARRRCYSPPLHSRPRSLLLSRSFGPEDFREPANTRDRPNQRHRLDLRGTTAACGAGSGRPVSAFTGAADIRRCHHSGGSKGAARTGTIVASNSRSAARLRTPPARGRCGRGPGPPEIYPVPPGQM